MSKLGTKDFAIHNPETTTAFGFIDADNIKKGLESALVRRGLTDAERECFSLKSLLEIAQQDRYYLYSAVELGSSPMQWIAELRALEKFVFRGSVLTSAGSQSKQEGVDVRLALEAIQCAHKRTMSRCTIFSCDGDLLPLVDALVSEGIFTTVACFNDPELGDVASRLRDAADSYVHIGDRILTRCFSQQHRLYAQNIQNTAELIKSGRIEEVPSKVAKWEIVNLPEGGAVLIRDRRSDSESHTWRFPTEVGARAWQKINEILYCGRSEAYLDQLRAKGQI